MCILLQSIKDLLLPPSFVRVAGGFLCYAMVDLEVWLF